MDDDALQELAIWKDKYNRLAEQHASLLYRNQELEDRLINVVDKIERDKSLLSDEIDHLAERLACASNTIDHIKGECARYKSDCMLAVHLLQCQPSFYTSQHLSSLPGELKQKLCSDTSSLADGSTGNRVNSSEKKVVSFSTSAMTFPPTAVFLQAEESSVDEAPPDEPESRHDFRDIFLKKITMAPEYQTEKLVQCPKCGFAVVKYDRRTQTIGDSYLSNSRSAPHLFALEDESESEHPCSRTRRPITSSGGDLLIDLSDEDHISSPTSPTIPEANPFLASGQQQHQVRLNVSPGVHCHPAPVCDPSASIPMESYVQHIGAVTPGGGPKYEPTRRQDFRTIPASNNP